MDEKTLSVLEYPKILDRLAGYCAFPASMEKARGLRPTADMFEARRRLAETSEARRLLESRDDLSIGGARDVRAAVDLALHGGVLDPSDLLDIKYTLVAARNLARTFERLADQFPYLSDIAAQLPPPMGVVDAITRSLSERGEVLDSASDRLANIRRDLHIVHDRLMAKLQRMVTDPKTAPLLQEALVTLRDGRYVLPLRAEFKGRIRSIVHDQSASGATLFVEPITVVEQNNQYRELQLAERDEVHRILSELSRQVGLHAFEITHAVEVIAELDLALARGKYALDLVATEPELYEIKSPPSVRNASEANAAQSHPGSVIRLYQARHPLLDPATVVPIDVELDDRTYAMVITGPNTGGKTVTLKTIGLLALMAQSGLLIPAQAGSEISLFEKIFADIGDEQSIEQSLSTFSGHITNIIRILEQADPHSLVILDELGAGTDPQEGAALARALLTHLLRRGVTTLVTTHHPELKAFAHATPGVVNASVEFDLETLRPTFHLTVGLPGRSNALAIAERLGMPEAIIHEARAEINPDDLRADDLLNEIHHQHDLARQARLAAELARKNSEALRSELLAKLDQIEDERRKIIEQARQEAEAQLEIVHEELASVRRALQRARQPAEALQAVEEQVESLQEMVEQPVERRASPVLSTQIETATGERVNLRRPVRLGDKVRLRTLGMQGIVTALSEEEAEIQVGVLRVRARLSQLILESEAKAADILANQGAGEPAAARSAAPRRRRESQPTAETRPKTISLPESPGMELDLRGKRADEAQDELERYLDAAFLAGMPFVRIIHGKGTGKLRDVVRQALSHNPHVRSFEGGGEKEGGEGVTIAKM